MPELPEPPKLVLAKQKRRKVPHWHYLVPGSSTNRTMFGRFDFPDWVLPNTLRVVSHPANDPGAVKIIQNAHIIQGGEK